VAFGWVAAVGAKLVGRVCVHGGDEEEAEVEEFVVLVVEKEDGVASFLKKNKKWQRCRLQVTVKRKLVYFAYFSG